MDAPERPYISYEPGKQWGTACLSRTRMTVECVVFHWWAGDKALDQMIADSWPVEDRDSLLVCSWYAARHWHKPWRKRWGKWLKQWEYRLWAGEWEAVELPPQKQGKRGEECS